MIAFLGNPTKKKSGKILGKTKLITQHCWLLGVSVFRLLRNGESLCFLLYGDNPSVSMNINAGVILSMKPFWAFYFTIASVSELLVPIANLG